MKYQSGLKVIRLTKCSLSRQLPWRRSSQNHQIYIYRHGLRHTGLEIVLAADNEIEHAVALKQTGSNNYIAGRLEDCQISAQITTEIPVVSNVAHRPLESILRRQRGRHSEPHTTFLNWCYYCFGRSWAKLHHSKSENKAGPRAGA